MSKKVAKSLKSLEAALNNMSAEKTSELAVRDFFTGVLARHGIDSKYVSTCALRLGNGVIEIAYRELRHTADGQPVIKECGHCLIEDEKTLRL